MKAVALVVVTALVAAGCQSEPDPPNVIGKNGEEAEETLRAQEFEAEFISDPVFARDECRVTKQSEPQEGALNPSVKLRCEFPVPDVVGMEVSRAQLRLGPRMQAEVPQDVYAVIGRGGRCKVTRQSVTGTALWQTKVRLKARCTDRPRRRQQRREPARDCDPNYKGGCVPPYPPDVDCDSVSGPVVVTGEDVHALDENDDTQACEGP